MLGRIPTFLLTTCLLMVVILVVSIPWSDLLKLHRKRFSIRHLLGVVALLGTLLGLARYLFPQENPIAAMTISGMMLSMAFVLFSLAWYFLRTVFQPNASNLRDRWRNPNWNRDNLPQAPTCSSNHPPRDSPPGDRAQRPVVGRGTDPERRSGRSSG